MARSTSGLACPRFPPARRARPALAMPAIVPSVPSMSSHLVSKDQHGGRLAHGDTPCRPKIRTPRPWTLTDSVPTYLVHGIFRRHLAPPMDSWKFITGWRGWGRAGSEEAARPQPVIRLAGEVSRPR